MARLAAAAEPPVEDRVPGQEGPSPGLARAVGGALTEDPGEASRLEAHEDGLAVEEALIEAQRQDQGAASLVEDRQKFAGPPGGLVDPTAQGGATGQAADGQQDGEQGEDLGEAEAHGAGSGRELLLLIQGAVDGLFQPVPQLTVLSAELGDRAEELRARRSREAGILDRLEDLVGVVIGGLARAARFFGLAANSAVLAAQTSRGVADPTEQG